MDGEGERKAGQRERGNTLGQHFKEEERQLALATKKGGCLEGAKLSEMVNRHLKLLNHVVKVRRDSHLDPQKRAIVRLLS